MITYILCSFFLINIIGTIWRASEVWQSKLYFTVGDLFMIFWGLCAIGWIYLISIFFASFKYGVPRDILDKTVIRKKF